MFVIQMIYFLRTYVTNLVLKVSYLDMQIYSFKLKLKDVPKNSLGIQKSQSKLFTICTEFK